MEDGKENGYYRGYYINGRLSAEGWLKDGKAQGTWLYYDEPGTLTARTHYLNGDLSGYKEEYLPNGKKSFESKYDGGWLEQITQYDSTGKVLIRDSFPKGSGNYVLLYPNGAKMAEGRYVNGDLDGPYRTYFFDGSPESILYYKKGLPDSSFRNFYFGGAKLTEGQYSGGKKTGTWTSYNEEGKITGTSVYRNNLLNGSQIYYNDDGSRDFEIQYKDDERNGLAVKNDPAGSIVYGTRYEDGDIVSYTYPDANGKFVPEIPVPLGSGELKAYFANGKPSRICIFSDGKINGTDTIYYANGRIRSTDNSVYGYYEGPRKEYHPNGALKYDYHYLTDNLNGVCRQYNENGILIKEMNFINGVLHGPVSIFNAGGRPKETRFYYYGRLLSVKNEK
jgi:antitoxin component YwqK of YwqJK toxin-antitoxin module